VKRVITTDGRAERQERDCLNCLSRGWKQRVSAEAQINFQTKEGYRRRPGIFWKRRSTPVVVGGKII